MLGQGIYKIPYCGKIYIGQTSKSFEVHIQEHTPSQPQLQVSYS